MTETFGVYYSLTGVKTKSMIHVYCIFNTHSLKSERLTNIPYRNFW